MLNRENSALRKDTLNRVQHGGYLGLIFRNRHYNMCIRSGAFGIKGSGLHVASSASGLYNPFLLLINPPLIINNKSGNPKMPKGAVLILKGARP